MKSKSNIYGDMKCHSPQLSARGNTSTEMNKMNTRLKIHGGFLKNLCCLVHLPPQCLPLSSFLGLGYFQNRMYLMLNLIKSKGCFWMRFVLFFIFYFFYYYSLFSYIKRKTLEHWWNSRSQELEGLHSLLVKRAQFLLFSGSLISEGLCHVCASFPGIVRLSCLTAEAYLSCQAEFKTTLLDSEPLKIDVEMFLVLEERDW